MGIKILIVEDEAFKKMAIERIYLESERLHELIEISKGLSYTTEEFKDIRIDKFINEISEDMSIKAQKYSIKIINDLESGIVSGSLL